VVLEFLWVRPHLLGGGRIKSFPETVTESSKAFINYGDTSVLRLAGNTKLRSSGIKVELYPDNAKVAKQFQHADKRSIPLQV
jgi:histidyl-tRNA synthetase